MMKRLILMSLSVSLAVAIAACGGSASTESVAPPLEATPSAAATPSSPEPVVEPEASPASAQASNPSAPPETPSTISGRWVSGEHPTQGTVRIGEQNGQRYIEFADDFQTNNGPDLFVILHRSTDVIGSTYPPAYPIQEGDYVAIAPLQSTRGLQRYAIPDSVVVEDYASVAIWCRQFNATFGAASLR